MSLASPTLLNWEPPLSPPMAGEHMRGPVYSTAPGKRWLKPSAVPSVQMPVTPRKGAEVNEIRNLLIAHGETLMERMEALMRQQEQVISRMLETRSMRQWPRTASVRTGSKSDATFSHSSELICEDAMQNAPEVDAGGRDVCSVASKESSATRSSIFSMDYRQENSLVLKTFSGKQSSESRQSPGGPRVWAWLGCLKGWSTKEEIGIGPLRSVATKMAQSKFFDIACGLVIILNAALLGASTDIAARNINPEDLPHFFTRAEWIFTVLFSFELCVRLLAVGCVRFFVSKEWTMNVFDLLLVVLDLVEKSARLFGGGTASQRRNFTAMRILRVLRIVRITRIIRLVRFFKELRMMVYSVMRSGLLLLWAVLLLIIIIFVFSTYLTQIVTYYLHDHMDDTHETTEKLRTYFGSLIFAGYMLFQCVSGGISWGEVSLPLLEIHWSHGVVFCFFIFFTVLAVLNIFTAIFVDTAFKSAMADRHEVIQEAINFEDTTINRMRNFFEETDLDRSGTITLEELQQQLQNQNMRAHLSSLGITANNASSIFRLLDVDKSGEISIEEFIFGCLKIQGTAKSIDLVALIHQQKRLKDRLTQFLTSVHQGFKQQQFFMHKLETLILNLDGPYNG